MLSCLLLVQQQIKYKYVINCLQPFFEMNIWPFIFPEVISVEFISAYDKSCLDVEQMKTIK